MTKFRLVRILFSGEAVCWTQVLHSFFDEQYEMEEGFEYEYDLPSLSETQRKNKELIKEINDGIDYTLDASRAAKSRWHHRQVFRIKLQELKRIYEKVD